MKIKVFHKGFNYSQDGQGNRLVYHLQGCNMRCPWCANPEGISVSGPSCVECDIGEMVEEALRSTPMFFDGGGVTLTGGEPTLQYDAVAELLARLKASAVHTALETNGTHERLSELFPLVDELIVDLKHYDSAVHKTHTGIDNEMVITNIQAAREARSQLLCRIPLVSGFNADIADIPGFIRLLRELNFPGLSVELLTYHEFGREKWAKCGMQYRVENGLVPPGIVSKFTAKCKDNGIRLIKT